MIRDLLRKGGAFLTLFVLLGSLFAPVASADTTNNNPDGAFDVVVSPPSIGLEVQPGKTVSTDLKIENQGFSTEHVKVSVLKFGARGQDGTPDIQDIQPGDDFVNWIHFSQTKFDAPPNVWETIHTTISPPQGSAFGYYYAVVFSRDNGNTQTTKHQANLLGAVASLILLDVNAPGAVRKVSIAEFSTPHKVQEFLPVNFTVRMHNTGNVHVASRGNIIISRDGKNLGILEVNLNKGYILPNSYRKFTANWSDGTPAYQQKTADGKVVLVKNSSQPQQSLSWDKFSIAKLRFGKYDAKLVMVYDDGHGDVETEANLSFWVMPWRIIAVVLVVAILILGGLWALVIRPLRIRLMGRRGYAGRR